MILGYSRNEWQNSEMSDKKDILYEARNEWQNPEMSDKKKKWVAKKDSLI